MKSIGAVITNLLTFEEFERLPIHDEAGKHELLDGEQIEMPPADREHTKFSMLTYHLLLDALKAAHARGEALDLGEVLIEAGYKLPGARYLRPDVSITHAAHRYTKYFEDSPAIAIEVSESNTAREMEKKVVLYLRYGNLPPQAIRDREVWHVYRDPLHFVIHYGDTSRTILEDAVTTPLLPGSELPLATFQGLIEKA